MKEAAVILGILPKLDPERKEAKHVLEFLFSKIVNFKKLNQENNHQTITRVKGDSDLVAADEKENADFSFVDDKADSKDDFIHFDEKPISQFEKYVSRK